MHLIDHPHLPTPITRHLHIFAEFDTEGTINDDETLTHAKMDAFLETLPPKVKAHYQQTYDKR